MRKQNEVKDRIKHHREAIKKCAKNLVTQPISFIHGNAKSIMYNRFCIETLNDMLISIKDMHTLSKTLSEKLGETIKPPYEDIFNHRLSCVIRNTVQYSSVNSEYGNVKTRAQADAIEWLSGN